MTANRFDITFADGRVETVQANARDVLGFELFLSKNKRYGNLASTAFRSIYYRAWSAAQRAGATDMTWLEFSEGPDAVLDVSAADAEEDDADDDELGALEVDGLGEGTEATASTI